MILFNFWDINSVLESLQNAYHLSSTQLSKIIEALYLPKGECYDPIKIFFAETEIRPDIFDPGEIYLHCKLITAPIDHCQSIKENGIVNLIQLLEGDNPLSFFLLENGIKILPSQHRWYYNGNMYDLPDSSTCAEKSSCRNPKAEERQYYDSISQLASKLYNDHGEIEAFAYASKEEMHNYSTVKNYPEILGTLDTAIKNAFHTTASLGDKWSERTNGYYEICFNVKYDDTSYRSNYEISSDLFWPYEQYCSREYDSLDDVPELYWKNSWIIIHSLNALTKDPSTVYVGIKNGVKICNDQIAFQYYKANE